MDEYCPIADKLEEEIFQSDSFKSLEKQNQLFLKFLTAEAKLRTPLKLRNLDYVYDPLIWEVNYTLQVLYSSKYQYITLVVF